MNRPSIFVRSAAAPSCHQTAKQAAVMCISRLGRRSFVSVKPIDWQLAAPGQSCSDLCERCASNLVDNVIDKANAERIFQQILGTSCTSTNANSPAGRNADGTCSFNSQGGSDCDYHSSTFRPLCCCASYSKDVCKVHGFADGCLPEGSAVPCTSCKPGYFLNSLSRQCCMCF